MKKSRLVLSVVLTFTLIFSSIGSTAFAAPSYGKCKSQVWGWSTSVQRKTSQVIEGERTVLERTNKQSVPIKYTKETKVAYSATFGGSLSGELRNSIEAGTGKVTGGLGSAVNAQVYFSGTVAKTEIEKISTKIKPKHKLTVNIRKKGDRINGYGKHFILWIETRRGTINLGIPKWDELIFYQKKI